MKKSHCKEGTSLNNEEFQEEEVWGDHKDPYIHSDNLKHIEEGSCLSKLRALTIPEPTKSPISQGPMIIQHSTPINIPNRSKIHGTTSKYNNFKKSRSKASSNYDDGRWDSDEEEEEGNMIPPHEFIARKLVRNQITSSSVCEGAGRTLKGRDLRRGRNVVLTKTGFLE